MAIEQTQYNAIGSNYNTIKTLPFSYYERTNVQNVIQPIFKQHPNAAVLDLACGTGFISRSLIDWGAARVLGIDISSSMVEAARVDIRPVDEGKLKYEVGDARSLKALDVDGNEVTDGTGKFDVVIGTWMLNYADSAAEMKLMWESVAKNLKDDGVFVGLTPKAEDDLDALVQRRKRFNEVHPEYFEVTWSHPEKLSNGEGWLGRMNGHGVHNFQFEWYHLPKDVHEQAARAAGMAGSFEWTEPTMSEEDRARASSDYWDKYLNFFGPHFSLFTVAKSSSTNGHI